MKRDFEKLVFRKRWGTENHFDEKYVGVYDKKLQKLGKIKWEPIPLNQGSCLKFHSPVLFRSWHNKEVSASPVPAQRICDENKCSSFLKDGPVELESAAPNRFNIHPSEPCVKNCILKTPNLLVIGVKPYELIL